MAPPFGFFKKKEKMGDRIEPTVAAPEAESLSIKEAQSLLENLESARVRWLAGRLEPLRQSAAGVLATLGSIAEGMQREKIELEDLEKRYGSTVETARRTVVSALRRESSSEFPQIKSVSDAKKFREKLDALLNRMGEVSGSHSKMLNYFLKKHADRMRGEFNKLEDLQKEARSVLASFEQERAPLVKCFATVNTVTQKTSSIATDLSVARSVEESLAKLKEELEKIRISLAEVKESAEFAQAKEADERLAEVRKQQDRFRSDLSEMFSHVSRALTKYSYNVSKETERRLQVMSTEPWKMFGEELPSYSELLQEIIKSVRSGQIQLKDSEKVLQNLETIQTSLPHFEETAATLAEKAADLSKQDAKAARHALELEEAARALEQEIELNRQDLEQKRRQIGDKDAEVDLLLHQMSEGLVELTGKRYKISR